MGATKQNPLHPRDHEVLSEKQGVQYWLSLKDFSDRSIEQLIAWIKMPVGENLLGQKLENLDER